MTSWQLLSIMVGLVAGWSVILLGVTRYHNNKNSTDMEKALKATTDQMEKSLKAVTDQTEKSVKAITDQIAGSSNLERDLLKLQADLPLNYVRKEDFIRHEVVINAKLDRIFDKLQGGVECK